MERYDPEAKVRTHRHLDCPREAVVEDSSNPTLRIC